MTRVALVSTYPPAACGIANYTAYLRNALAAVGGVDVRVLAEQTDDDDGSDPNVIRCWHRDGDWTADILAEVERATPDVVHVQHEEAILGQSGRLPGLLDQLRARGIRTVVTLHSVYGGGRGWLPGRWPPVRFQRALGRASNRVIVHQTDGCRDRLLSQGLPEDRVVVIAHGTHMVDLPAAAAARAGLGVDGNARVALSLGFIHPKKGTHTLVRAFRTVVAHVPNARLIIAGRPRRRNVLDSAYHAWLGNLMRPGVQAGWLDYRPGFHSADDARDLLAAAEVLALPYRQSYGSASGILHTALGAGRPVLCASGPKFAEAYGAWGAEIRELFPAPGDVGAWADALIRVLSDADLRSQMAARSRALGRGTSWAVVARRHQDVYSAVIDA